MKWDFKEPALGDAVRVKLGSIYHYGIVVGDDEVVQFGLAPNLMTSVAVKDIAVCLSNAETFLQGGILECGTPEKRDGKRRSPSEVVAYANSQLGRTGYHILNNNCEHFVYECIFGIKKSEQTDGIREMFANMPIADVYTYKIPKNCQITPLYPTSRDEEISCTSNQDVKMQKYCAWKLLEYALMRTFGYKIKELSFSKSSEGKWTCNRCYFSISHSGDLVAVALSKRPIGVDCEIFRGVKGDAIERVLTRQEAKQLKGVLERDRERELLSVWTKKESLFKRDGEGKFLPSKTNTAKVDYAQKSVAIDGEEYILTVCTDYYKTVRYFDGIELD